MNILFLKHRWHYLLNLCLFEAYDLVLHDLVNDSCHVGHLLLFIFNGLLLRNFRKLGECLPWLASWPTFIVIVWRYHVLGWLQVIQISLCFNVGIMRVFHCFIFLLSIVVYQIDFYNLFLGLVILILNFVLLLSIVWIDDLLSSDRLTMA